MTNKTILLISPEAWGINFVSKHHYANYLSKDNNVYFLNPAHGFNKNPFGKINIEFKQIKPGLTVIDYINLIPRLNHFPQSIQRFIYKKHASQIKLALKTEQNITLDFVWSFDPFRFFDQKIWNLPTTIYHTVDFHPMAKYEKEIILSSDHFFGVTDLVLKEHPYRKGFKISHAADLDGFLPPNKPKLPGENNIRACYVGNLHKHINYATLDQLANENFEVDFIIIGPIEASNLSRTNKIDDITLKKLQTYPNVHFLGSIPSHELMGYIKQCDVHLVLFKKEHEKTHCSPHKLMGYFYSGKITLSNYIDEHKETDIDIIQMVNNQKDVPVAFRKIIENLIFYNHPDKMEKRKQFAIENSYTNKLKEIENHLFK